MRMYHGPIDSRPAAARARMRLFVLGPDLEVVVDHRHLAVEEEPGVGGVALEQRRGARRASSPAAAGSSGTARTTPGPSGCGGRWRCAVVVCDLLKQLFRRYPSPCPVVRRSPAMRRRGGNDRTHVVVVPVDHVGGSSGSQGEGLETWSLHPLARPRSQLLFFL